MERNSVKKVIRIKDEDVELDIRSINFYKKETGKSHVTKKGLSRFFNKLFDIFFL